MRKSILMLEAYVAEILITNSVITFYLRGSMRVNVNSKEACCEIFLEEIN